jgi:hypothetical protein
LASGHKYLPSDGRPSPAALLDEGEGWIGEEPLILTAYHRYLQQIGFIDRFLGELRHSLKTAHLYDNALIILTADHGVSFRRGSSRRLINSENTLDILKVPMIVKVPGQRKGRVSERLVSGVDVLPTIMDVLEVKTSWKTDGFSLVNEKEPPRTKIEVHNGGVFNAAALQDFSRLEWQIENFQDHSSLNQVGPMGPFPSLIGQAISNLPRDQSTDLRVVHPDRSHFENVDPASGFLPALIWAYILNAKNQNLLIAVALNGKIWATTKTVEWMGEDNYFSVLLPPTAFKRGRNALGVYLIDPTGRRLTPIPLKYGQLDVRLRRDPSGEVTLLYANGPAVPVGEKPQTFPAHLDRVSTQGNLLVFEGWAADIGALQPAEILLIFAGEQLVAQVKPIIKRPDVVKVLHQKGLLHSGFRAEIPLAYFTSVESEPLVIIVSQEPRAFRFRFNEEQKKFIRAVLKKNTIRLKHDLTGQLTILYPNGPEVLVEAGPKTIRGHIDRVSTLGNLFVFEGWAADIGAPQPAETLLIFAGEHLVTRVKPEFKRSDVVKVIQENGVLHSGFRAEIPLSRFISSEAEPRVIIVSQGPRAVSLPFDGEQKKFIRSVLQTEPIQ